MSNQPNRDYYSMQKYVRSTDVIWLDKGQLVYYQRFPACFHKNGNPYSTQLTDGLVQIGVSYHRVVKFKELRFALSDAVNSLFDYYHVPLNPNILERFIVNQVPAFPEESFTVPEGLYQIYDIKAEWSGQKVSCKTYQPTEDRPEMLIYFFIDSHSPANHHTVKIIKDLDRIKNQI